MKKFLFFPFTFLLSSCNIAESLGTSGIIIMFAVITLIFAGMLFMILKRKNRAKLSLSSFSADVQNLLNGLTDPVDKIAALNQLVQRIENDEKYRKAPDWKDSVLAKVYEHMAAVYYEIGDEQGVVDASGHIIELDPGNGLSYYNRGSMYSNMERYEEALSDFNDAIQLMPGYVNAYNNRGLVLDKLGRYEEALSDFDYAAELEPSAIIYYNRANLYYELEKYELAKEDYLRSLELDPWDKNKLNDDIKLVVKVINDKLSKN